MHACRANFQWTGKAPALDSKYVSLMITGDGHSVDHPMPTCQGDFGEPQKMLIFTERAEDDQRGETIEGVDFPPVGQRDANTFENNLREVMQFVLNHRIFDPDGELDEKHLAANEALGVMPGQAYDPDRVANLDGQPAQEAVCSVVSTNDGEPLNAQYDFGIDVVLRLYLPDLEGFETWTPPMAEKI